MTELLADKLQRLCCAETEGKFFDCVTDNIDEILRALRLAAKPAEDGVREALDAADLYITRLRTSLAGKSVYDMDEVAEHWSQSSRKVRRALKSPNTGAAK
jgi:hypothetical protein